jgi:hypothetical protein
VLPCGASQDAHHVAWLLSACAAVEHLMLLSYSSITLAAVIQQHQANAAVIQQHQANIQNTASQKYRASHLKNGRDALRASLFFFGKKIQKKVEMTISECPGGVASSFSACVRLPRGARVKRERLLPTQDERKLRGNGGRSTGRAEVGLCRKLAVEPDNRRAVSGALQPDPHLPAPGLTIFLDQRISRSRSR